MKADQFDLSLEWYFDPDKGGMAWINLFHKDIKDYFRHQSQLVAYPGADGNEYDYLITRPINTGTARIQGAEIGWNQFFDFLPAPFDGFGISANYTYIDSSTDVPNEAGCAAGRHRWLDVRRSAGRRPVQELLQRRRLLREGTLADPCGLQLAQRVPAVGRGQWLQRHQQQPRRRSIAWKLPVYSDDYGQLDGSIFYSFNDNIKLGLEMNNLNNAEQRTIMDQNGAGQRVTSWYVNDTRYAATLRVTF